jgi:hypothetical protein
LWLESDKENLGLQFDEATPSVGYLELVYTNFQKIAIA